MLLKFLFWQSGSLSCVITNVARTELNTVVQEIILCPLPFFQCGIRMLLQEMSGNS